MQALMCSMLNRLMNPGQQRTRKHQNQEELQLRMKDKIAYEKT